MITVDEIRNEVNRIVDILKDVKTIEDCCSLRRYGYSEDQIFVTIPIGDVSLNEALFYIEEAGPVELEGVGVCDDETMSGVSYVRLNNGSVYFDVFDSEFDEEYNMLEDCTLVTLEEDYANAVTALEQDL